MNMETQTNSFNPANMVGAVGASTTEVIAALMVFAVAMEDCAQMAGDLSQLSESDKRKWVWNGKNLLVAKPFYAGIYQALSQHKEIKAKFGKEFAYIEQNLKFADFMLQDPRIVKALFDEAETVH